MLRCSHIFQQVSTYCLNCVWKIPRKELDKYIDRSVEKNYG